MRLIFFILFITTTLSYALSNPKSSYQVPKFDSLMRVFEKQEISDSLRINAALQLSWLNRNISPDNAFLYAKISEDLSRRNNLIFEEIRGISYQGIALRNKGEYQRAMQLFLTALEKATKIDSKEDQAYAHINIASVNIYQENFDEATVHLELAEVIANILKDKRILAYIDTNYGRVYQGSELFNKAVFCFKEALLKREEMDDNYGQIVSYADIGKVYLEMGQIEKALEYLQASLLLNEKNLHDADNMVSTLTDIAVIYREKQDYQKANFFGTKAANISVESGLKHMALNAFIELKNIERLRGRFKKALEYDDKIEIYKDSVFSEEVRMKLAEMNVRYLVEQRVKENEILKKDKEINEIMLQRQTIILFSAVVLIIILVLFVYFLFIENKNKKVVNHKLQNQKGELELQSIEIQRINSLLKEKSQDMMDSINYAKGIQSAILPNWSNVKQLIPNSYVYFNPRDIVSGDFYWFKQVSLHQGILIAADCTGHGVPGGFMSMVGETALEYIVDSQKIFEPADILAELHARLSSMLSQKKSGNMDGMEIGICLIDTYQNIIKFSGAGMSMTIVENEGHEIVKGNQRGVGGVYSFSTSSTHTFEFDNSKMFFLYSDGYADQFGGPKGKKLKSPNFRKILEACYQLPVKDQKKFLSTQFDAWKGDEDQVDDVMVIGFTA
ncbi:tetratricopeptide repeat protein [Flammeovirga yaeyamensis]|uniref:Tetratricopeptide repeat protein n=1 Tax=Flammeovirga yaeyamensis TaxID=367791 RepID=A0AAX1MY77_9BACT|nr:MULTISPECIES: tetratricopeptide repeat protein [Flammeovirga]ANQ48336.1 tetratricopeptide repeat protein [Flammeovirga sp. MY04]MBB3696238.1 serine phosphatase RsbU (regulator of sigma subunit) [Flammeovirga yaeyamensis]NMF34919.1 tetratricopeptide repeat protein [Flammeovirga yaeyamensis]QWG00256.1 tetratricopeptide repeat protein [Flammeovirga yaeyamensis]